MDVQLYIFDNAAWTEHPFCFNILVGFDRRRFFSSLLGWSFIARIHGFLVRLTKSPKLQLWLDLLQRKIVKGRQERKKKYGIRSFAEKTAREL